MLVYWRPSKGPDPSNPIDLPQSTAVALPDIPEAVNPSALRNVLFPLRDKHEGLHHDFQFTEVNHATLSSLMLCLELSNCEPNQDKGEQPSLCIPDFQWLRSMLSGDIAMVPLPRCINRMGYGRGYLVRSCLMKYVI